MISQADFLRRVRRAPTSQSPGLQWGQEGSFGVSFVTLTGDACEIEVRTDECVNEVKQQLRDRLVGLPPHFMLISDGTELKTGVMGEFGIMGNAVFIVPSAAGLSDSSVGNGTLDGDLNRITAAAVAERGGEPLELCVRTIAGDEFDWVVDGNEEVQVSLAQHPMGAGDEVALTVGGEDVEMDMTWNDQDIGDGARVTWRAEDATHFHAGTALFETDKWEAQQQFKVGADKGSTMCQAWLVRCLWNTHDWDHSRTSTPKPIVALRFQLLQEGSPLRRLAEFNTNAMYAMGFLLALVEPKEDETAVVQRTGMAGYNEVGARMAAESARDTTYAQAGDVMAGRDKAMAIRQWQERAMAGGHAAAAYDLGMSCRFASLLPRDLEQAAAAFQTAAAGGYPGAERQLGLVQKQLARGLR